MAYPLGNLPSTTQKRALTGSTGTPDTGNEYLTKIEKAAASGLASLDGSSKLVQRLAYENVNGGVATLDGSSKVVQRSAVEGIANGVATLDASVRVPIAQLFMAPVSPVQTGTFSANATYGLWVIDTSGGSGTMNLPAANSVPNGFIIRAAKTSGANNVTIAPNGGDTISGATSLAGGGYESFSYASDGVSKWYQVCAT